MPRPTGRRPGSPPKNAPPDAMPLQVFAKECGVSRQAIYNWISERRLEPRYTAHGLPFFLPEDVTAVRESPAGRRRALKAQRSFERAMADFANQQDLS